MPKKRVWLVLGVLVFLGVNPENILADDPKQIANAALSAEMDRAIEEQPRAQPMLLAQAVSNKCSTPSMICVLSQYGAVGTPCWCIGPYGPIAGVLVP